MVQHDPNPWKKKKKKKIKKNVSFFSPTILWDDKQKPTSKNLF